MNVIDERDMGVTASPGAEEWLGVVGYEGLYEVSSLGRVRSRYAVNDFVLSTAGTDKDGYPVVSLSGPDGRHTFALHRLVCRAFHGEPNALHREAAHLDGNRKNARADNLKWVSKAENHFHMRAHGTHQSGERHPRAKLTEDDVRAIRLRAASGEGATKTGHDYKDIARDLLTVIPQAEACSFCPAFAATQVSDDNDILPACQRCADAWALDPGFTSNEALSTSSSTLTPDAARLFELSDDAKAELVADRNAMAAGANPRRLIGTSATPAIRDQAFEEGRLAGIASAAGVVTRKTKRAVSCRSSSSLKEFGNEIAQAIRALKGTPPSTVDADKAWVSEITEARRGGWRDAMATARAAGPNELIERLQAMKGLVPSIYGPLVDQTCATLSTPSPDLLKELVEALECAVAQLRADHDSEAAAEMFDSELDPIRAMNINRSDVADMCDAVLLKAQQTGDSK